MKVDVWKIHLQPSVAEPSTLIIQRVQAVDMHRISSAQQQLPFPRKPKFIGYSSAAFNIIFKFHGPGVQVVAFVPSAGPVPPPIIVVTPLYNAQSICCGLMKWIWVSIPPAVTIIPSPASASVDAPTVIPGVTPSMMSGFPEANMRQCMARLQEIRYVWQIQAL